MATDTDKNRIVALILIAIIAAASISLAIVMGQRKSADIRRDLSDRSQTIAAALGTTQISRLGGTASDTKKQEYAALKVQLAAVKAANHNVRSVYLAGIRGERIFFFVDSEKAGSSGHSPAGEWYDDATPAFTAMFANGQPLVEGPVRDSFGTFISGLAPIKQSGSNHVIAVVGIDMDASTYWRTVFLAALIPLSTGLSIILIVGVFEWMRRRNLQLLALRSELVSVASHELRTPIVGIKWGAESLVSLVKDEKAMPYIHAIRNSALSLQASADDILELTSAINDNKLKLADVRILELVQDVMDTQQLAAAQKHVTLALDASITPELEITCDPDKLKRVLHNMISNAVKYTRESTTVTISYQSDDTMHRLLITDQGIGIPPTEQGKVLQGFYRASNAIASKVQGTGLGLYLVKTVLEQHGGKVSFISEENKGTTFTLSLPKRRK